MCIRDSNLPYAGFVNQWKLSNWLVAAGRVWVWRFFNRLFYRNYNRRSALAKSRDPFANRNWVYRINSSQRNVMAWWQCDHVIKCRDACDASLPMLLYKQIMY